MVGSRCTVGRILGATVPSGPYNGKVPAGEIALRMLAKEKASGPWLRVKTGYRLAVVVGPQVGCCAGSQFESWSDCCARTGRFCVTTWPKLDPNTPMSNPRP